MAAAAVRELDNTALGQTGHRAASRVVSLIVFPIRGSYRLGLL